MWSALPVVLTWIPNIVSYPYEKRAVAQASVNMGMSYCLLCMIRDERIGTVANLASIYGSYLWPSDDAPRYTMGLSVTSAFCFACALSALAMKYLDRKYPYSFDFAKWGTEDENEEVIIIEKEPA